MDAGAEAMMDAGAEAKGVMRRHAAEEVWLVGLTAHVHFHSSTVTRLSEAGSTFS